MFVVLWQGMKASLKNMIVFHDYLISYKQTPRSRIFKRYRPPMEAIEEMESQYERSECASMVASNRNQS